jgi:2'-5' RNA ligase
MSENQNKLLRLFVAILIPEVVRSEMHRLQQELRPLAATRDVRWTNPEQLHLTLKFLGNVPANSLDAVKQSLAEASNQAAPFHLRAKGIGFFPNERRPRVIWVGFDDGNELSKLQSHVEKSLVPFAEEPREEKFLPHATLGRFQKYRRHKTEMLLPRALQFGGITFGEWQVATVELFRSELSSSGACHSLLASFTLGAK